MAILEIKDLDVRFATPDGDVHAVNKVNLDIGAGECLGVVGESGSGKSQLFLATLGLLSTNGRATGSVKYRDKEILGVPPDALNKLRGSKITMIFQDPLTCLTPHMRIGAQIMESLRIHERLPKDEAEKRALEVLEMVRMPDGPRRMKQYPHELSGGMRQRVMIAMAVVCGPDLLIADEPTTALDVTLQAQILELMRELKAASGAAIILITHDLGVVAEVCDEVAVMYAGEIVERAPVDELFSAPQHPYTVGLLGSIPRLDHRAEQLATIEGMVPNMAQPPAGCRFAARCPFVLEACTRAPPPLMEVSPGHVSRCIRAPLEVLVS